MAHNKSLYSQSTFLEGMAVEQPRPEMAEELVPFVTTISVPEGITFTQQQISWVAASVLCVFFILFLVGYHFGSVHAENNHAFVPSRDIILGLPERSERQALHAQNGRVLAVNEPCAGSKKIVSRSVSGVERTCFCF